MSVKTFAPMYEVKTFTPKNSKATDAEVGVWSVPCFRTKTLTFTAQSNTMTVTVQKSTDNGVTYANAEVAFDVTTAAQVIKTYTDPFTHIKVLVKDKVGGVPGTLETTLFGTWI